MSRRADVHADMRAWQVPGICWYVYSNVWQITTLVVWYMYLGIWYVNMHYVSHQL